MLSQKISALAIVLNEEDNIRDYLHNMSFADEIIVVDSYSVDQTIDIIEKEFPKVKIYKRTFDNFSSQRNYAISLATNDWIIFFDADERLTESGIAEIKKVAHSSQCIDAFWVKRIFYRCGKPINYGGKNQDKAIRVFKKSKCNYSSKLVHEQLTVNGTTGVLSENCHHYSYKNKEDFLKKRLKYAKLKASELFQIQVKPNLFHFYIKPLIRFIKHYIVEGAILNGKAGIDLSYIMAQHVYMRYVYLQELYQNSTSVLLNQHDFPKMINIGYEAKRVFHNRTGLGNYSRDLVRILSTFHSHLNFYLYNPKKADVERFIPNNTNVFEILPKTTFTKILSSLWRQLFIISDLKADKIDIFHGLSGELPIGLRSANIKSVVTIHDLIFMRYPSFYRFFDRAIYFYKFKYAAKAADVVIAISEQTKRDIIQFLGIPASKIVVVYQGCSDIFQVQYSNIEKQEVANKFNLPAQFILNVGTIEPRKNVLAAAKAIKDIDTYLIIIGGVTTFKDEIISYVTQNNYKQKIIFLDGLTHKELAIIYQLATIFVYPSLFEGFGIPIIEALYSKIPVITTNSGVFPEAAGPFSIYVNPSEIDDIKDKIEMLLHNASMRTEIANKGFEFVQKFNNENIAANLMNVYKNLYV